MSFLITILCDRSFDCDMNSEVMIVGAGSVGSTIAYALMIKEIARHIYLVDVNKDKAVGESLDLNHGRAFVSHVEVHAGSYEDSSHVDLIIVTAGAKQKPGETRLDLLHKNVDIMHTIIDSIEENREDNEPTILIVSNPVDILTFCAHQFSKLPKNKIIGSGTALDTSRLRYEISNHCNIDARSIHGYIVGEHGDSEVALWSSLSIGNVVFDDFCQNCQNNCRGNVKQEMFNNVRNAAYKLINLKGFTNYGVGLATARITEAILKDQHSVLAISTVLNGEYGLDHLAISLPCVLGRKGVERIIQMKMDIEEEQNFKKSGKKLRRIIADLDS